MQKNWWKILGVLLLLYTFLAGLLVPISPGILQVSPTRAKTGETISLRVDGYNTQFSQSDQVRAWLKVDEEFAIAASKITPSDDTKMQATFTLPGRLPGEEKVQALTLVVDNPVEGAYVLPGAIFVTQTETGEIVASSGSPIENLSDGVGMNFPFRNILYETIRNLYFHVPLWFGLIIILLAACVFSIRYLMFFNPNDDRWVVALTSVGILYGILGLITGAIWAKFAWGQWWSWDVKQNMSAIAMLVYLAYFVLRNSFDDLEKQRRIGAVYNIFAFAALIPLLFVIPRLTSSLHPGNGGNPGFGGEDLDNTMRMVFYPAIIGWTLLGVWMAQLKYRTDRIEEQLLEE